MSLVLVGILVAVLAIVLWGLWVAGRELTEFEGGFVYAVWGLLLLLVGAAAYLAFALPSIATHNTDTGSVRRAQSNLLLEP